MRRAMSCEYCAPKSRTTIACVSTIYFAREPEQCKAEGWAAASGYSNGSVIASEDSRAFVRTCAVPTGLGSIFPPPPGLTPAANTNAAPAGLDSQQISIPPSIDKLSCRKDSKEHVRKA